MDGLFTRKGILLASFCGLLGSSGCGVPFRYYPQAALGQLELFNRARPIDEVLKDVRVPERIRGLLGEIPDIKKYGEALGLKATSSYVDYVALDRPAVVWVVSASPRLALEPKRWNFPIMGGFTYIGWFSREAADRHAEEIRRQEGLDVDVRGAGAYSTLGWFRDPVLSTMIPQGVEARAELVNVILHESVHATFYIDHQSAFNESLASFVADRLTDGFFARTRDAGGTSADAGLEQWRELEKKASLRRVRFHRAYLELEKLYLRKDISDAQKTFEKERVFGALRAEFKVPDARTLNNATLIQFKTYFTGQEDFAALLEKCGGQWDCFWKRLEPLRHEPEKHFERRQQEDFPRVLQALAQ